VGGILAKKEGIIASAEMRLRWAGRNPCTAGEREGVRAEALCRVPFSFGQAKEKKEGISGRESGLDSAICPTSQFGGANSELGPVKACLKCFKGYYFKLYKSERKGLIQKSHKMTVRC
jgi:hypothetical protein